MTANNWASSNHQTSCNRFLGCSRCDRLPDKVDYATYIYLWFPVAHSLAKAISYFQTLDIDYTLIDNSLGVRISGTELDVKELLAGLAAILTSKEVQDTQALLMPDSEIPQLADLSRMTSLPRLVSISQSDWLVDMLSEERYTTYFQPIVHTANPSHLYGFEALFRGLDESGKLIMPGKVFTAARDAGLLAQLDLAARRSTLREANFYPSDARLFINFSPAAVYDPAACLKSTVQAIDRVGIPHENIVFEITESEQTGDLNHLRSILKHYRDAGFLVALDDLGSGYSGLNLLHQLRPDLIKLDMELIRNVHQDSYKASITEKILEIAQGLNIQTVAEGIETLEELNWVRARGATFAQGYLIARPQPLLEHTHFHATMPLSA